MAYLRTLPSGKTQAIIRRLGHKPIVRTFRTKTMASEWARRIEDDVVRGTYYETLTARRITLNEVLDRYELTILPRVRSPSTMRSQIRVIRAFLGHLSMVHLSPESVINFIDSRLQSVKGESVRKDLNTLSRAVTFARGIIKLQLSENPVTVAREVLSFTGSLKTSESRVKRVTDDQIDQIERTSESKLLPKIVRFIVQGLTALRRGEVSNIRYEHVRGVELSIPETKTDKPRVIPLNDISLDIISSLPKRSDGYLFGLRPDSITQAFGRACRRASLSDLRFHDLRHEATSRLFELGLGIQEVAAITGHSDWKSLKRYTHPKPLEIRKKINESTVGR